MRVHVHNMTPAESPAEEPEKSMTTPTTPYRTPVDITNDHPDPKVVLRVTHMDDGKPGEVKDLVAGEVGHFHVFTGRKLVLEEIEL